MDIAELQRRKVATVEIVVPTIALRMVSSTSGRREDVVQPIEVNADGVKFRIRSHVDTQIRVDVEGVPVDPGFLIEGLITRTFRNHTEAAEPLPSDWAAPMRNNAGFRFARLGTEELAVCQSGNGTLVSVPLNGTECLSGTVTVSTLVQLQIPLPMAVCMRELRELRFRCDVILRTDGEDIPVHGVVLAAASTVLQLVLGADPKDTKDVVEMKASEKSVRMFVDYLYTGDVGDCDCTDTMVDLLELSDRYAVERLRAVCEARLLNVDRKNALAVLKAANERPVVPESVLIKATSVVVCSLEELIKSQEWTDYASKHPESARCLSACHSAFKSKTSSLPTGFTKVQTVKSKLKSDLDLASDVTGPAPADLKKVETSIVPADINAGGSSQALANLSSLRLSPPVVPSPLSSFFGSLAAAPRTEPKPSISFKFEGSGATQLHSKK